MIQIIHQFRKAACCKPADIVLEWDAKTGARLTANGPDGAKTALNVLCALNDLAPTGAPWSGRVLVMDDEEAVRKVVGLTLSAMGNKVEMAQDGQMAIE
jgi:hypothetical protein